jgi:hypothetical protein
MIVWIRVISIVVLIMEFPLTFGLYFSTVPVFGLNHGLARRESNLDASH